jgi:hypothetical protein
LYLSRFGLEPLLLHSRSNPSASSSLSVSTFFSHYVRILSLYTVSYHLLHLELVLGGQDILLSLQSIDLRLQHGGPVVTLQFFIFTPQAIQFLLRNAQRY